MTFLKKNIFELIKEYEKVHLICLEFDQHSSGTNKDLFTKL